MKKLIYEMSGIILGVVILGLFIAGCEPEAISQVGQDIQAVATDIEQQLTDANSQLQQTAGAATDAAGITKVLVKTIPGIPYSAYILAVLGVIEGIGLFVQGWRKKTITKALGVEKKVVKAIVKSVEKRGGVEPIKKQVALELQGAGIYSEGKKLIQDAKNH